MNPIDDEFFRKMAEDIEFCQEILQVIWGRRNLYRVFVNATVKDGSDVSELMDIFTKSEKYNYEKFPKTSARKWTFKERKEGQQEMSDIVREIALKERQEGRQEGRREGRNEGKAEDVDLICLNMGMSLQEACVALGITVEEYERAKNAMLTT